MRKAAKQKTSIYGDESAPVYLPMADIMKVDFVFNEDGGIWILHDKPLPDLLRWVEYDADMETVILVTRSGKIQDLGMPIPSKRGLAMEQAADVTVMLMSNGKVADFTIVPVIVRNTAVN